VNINLDINKLEYGDLISIEEGLKVNSKIRIFSVRMNRVTSEKCVNILKDLNKGSIKRKIIY